MYPCIFMHAVVLGNAENTVPFNMEAVRTVSCLKGCVFAFVFTALALCASKGDFCLRVNQGLKWRGCPSCLSPGFGWCLFFLLAPWFFGLFPTRRILAVFGVEHPCISMHEVKVIPLTPIGWRRGRLPNRGFLPATGGGMLPRLHHRHGQATYLW